jgi:four helix bundle protein
MVHGRSGKRVQILPRFKVRSVETRTIPRGAILESLSGMESRIIAERTFRFAWRTAKLCERLWSQGPAARKIADQLFDSGTSMGANTAESQGGQTKPDFIAKLARSQGRRAGKRSSGLRLAIAPSIVTKEEVAWELNEAQPLKAMITQAVKTGQASNWRGGA